MTALNPNKFGVRAVCKSCGLPKAPRGRSVPIGFEMCNHYCPGYLQDPHVGSLWPNESEADFGYEVGETGTRIKEATE